MSTAAAAFSEYTTMIYSRFGTKLTLVNKSIDSSGNIRVQATTQGSSDLREYRRGDLKADDGMPEIDAAVAKLPSRNVQR
jgi:hypothetical protein